jgi:hypothetical protein
MTSDLLFSILPREGKVAIKHDSQKVVKIDRLEELRVLSDEEKELKDLRDLKGEEREAKKKPRHNENEPSPEQDPSSEKVDKNSPDAKNKKIKGPKHLDIYV